MNPGPDIYLSFFKMVGAMILVVGLLLVSVRWLRSGRPGRSYPDMAVQMIGTIPLGIKKSIALVKVAERVLVIGLSGETIVLLDKIDDQEQVRMLQVDGRQGPKGFGKQLEKILVRRQDPQQTKSDLIGEEA